MLTVEAVNAPAPATPHEKDVDLLPRIQRTSRRWVRRREVENVNRAELFQEEQAVAVEDCIAALPPSSKRARRVPPFVLSHFLHHRDLIKRLHAVVLATKERLEGNCLCTFDFRKKEFYLQEGQKKLLRQNLFRLLTACGRAPALPYAELPPDQVGNLVIRSVLEVGFNAGHSCALFCYAWDMALRGRRHLQSSQKFEYLVFDLAEHEYAQRCFQLLQEEYADLVDMEFVPGDSRSTVRSYYDTSDDALGKTRTMSTTTTTGFGGKSRRTFDLIHIDGSHSSETAKQDIVNCRCFGRPYETVVVVDDAQFQGVEEVLEELIAAEVLVEIDYDAYAGGGVVEKTKVHRMFHYR